MPIRDDFALYLNLHSLWVAIFFGLAEIFVGATPTVRGGSSYFMGEMCFL